MNKYKDYSPEQQEELSSNYLIDSWSYSKVSTFARNEKAFEMSYIFNQKEKSSASNIAGKAYHKALESFFLNFKEGVRLDIVTLEQIAFDFIDCVPADEWKIQIKTPTVDDCIQVSTKDVSKLLNTSFLKLIPTYRILKKWLTWSRE